MTPSEPPGDPSPILLDPLLGSLLDLLHELGDGLPPLTIGGGFGLYLKRSFTVTVFSGRVYYSLGGGI